MESMVSLRAQIRSSWPTIVLVWSVSAIPLGALLFLHFWKGIPIGDLTRDPVAIADLPFYTGFLSQTGAFCWAGTLAICLFSAKVLPRDSDNLAMKRFLVTSGLLTLVLGVDDVFLLYETLFHRLGVPEKATYASYAVFVLFYLARFFRTIIKTEYALLVMAFGFFSISVGLDVLNPPGINPYLFEDGAKLVGIVSWLAYFYSVGTAALSPDLQATAPPCSRVALPLVDN
jgi:hypothetical protein